MEPSWWTTSAGIFKKLHGTNVSLVQQFKNIQESSWLVQVENHHILNGREILNKLKALNNHMIKIGSVILPM